MKVSSEVNGGGEILFTLNKGANFLRCGGLNPPPGCPGSSFRAFEENPFFCVEVPDCSGPDCFPTLEECESFQEPLYYCVTTAGGSVACCGSAIEGGWLCLSNYSGSLEDCASQDHSAGRTVFFSGVGCEQCDSLPVQYPLPYEPGGQVSAESGVTRIPVEEYDPSVHTIVSGPITGGESCFEGSSSTSDENSSSSSELHCPVLECGCEPSELNPCYSLDCGLNPNGTFVVDCDLCECVEVVASSSSTAAGSSSVSAESSSSASVPSSSTSVVSSSVTSGDGGGDGGGVVSYLCVRPKSSGLVGLDLPELENLVPAYSQSTLKFGMQPADSGEMMNNATYDSSYPVYRTMTAYVPGSSNWVQADYGQVGTFGKVRVGPPPCYKAADFSQSTQGAANGATDSGQGCDGSYYYSSSVQYSVDGVNWLSVGSTTYDPFFNAEKTLVGTELVGDGSLKEARYIRVVGNGLYLGLSELHAVTSGGGSGGVVSRDVFCLPVESYDSAAHDIVSGPYVGLGSCESNCPPEVVSSSSGSASEPSSSSVVGGLSSSSTGGGGDGGTGDGGTGDGGSTPGASSSTAVGSSSSVSGSSSSSVVTSSSSSVVVESSSSSVVTSSSSSNPYGYLDASFVTVLGLNPDFPEYYYGEDPVNGWAATSDRLLEFRYESLPLEGLPFAANVFIGGTPVASIVYPPAYEGRDFCVVSGGVFYCGVVDEAGVYL